MIDTFFITLKEFEKMRLIIVGNLNIAHQTKFQKKQHIV